MGDIFCPLTQDDVYCNGRLKVTPEGEVLECLWASRNIFRALAVDERETGRPRKGARFEEGREVWETEEATSAAGDRWEEEARQNRKRGAVRAKKRLYELARCNHFTLFFTLTLDGQKMDRYNYPAIVKRLNQWLDNMVRRHGLAYVLVPELHKDGALHFHGLCNKEAVKLVDSGHRDKHGKVIFNLPEWKFGFTTAVELSGNYEGVCHYVSKYIVKQFEGEGAEKPTGRYFYCGGALRRASTTYFRWSARPSGNDVEIVGANLALTYVDWEGLGLSGLYPAGGV